MAIITQKTKLYGLVGLLSIGFICGAAKLITAHTTTSQPAIPSATVDSSTAPASAAPPTTPQTVALRYGEVAISGQNGQYSAQVLVKAPAATVWKVLTDYDNFKAFLPNVSDSRLLSNQGSQKVFEQVNVFKVFSFQKRSRVKIAATESYPSKIDFRVIQGDVRSLKGAWSLSSAGGNQVLLTHNVAVQPEGSTNRGIFFNIYKSNLKGTLAAIRKESERRWSR